MPTCKKCGLQVVWRLDPKNNRMMCFNYGTHTGHWDTCSQERMRKIKETGTPYETKNEKGYLTDLTKSGKQKVFKSSKPIIGKKFRQYPDCKNCVPPWEECEDWKCQRIKT